MKLVSIGLLLATIAAPAEARDGAGHASIAVSGGTLGIGPEVGFRLSDHVGVRGSATFLGVGHGFDSDDLDYRGHVKLRSYGAMLDIYPSGGNFRLSAGARINRNAARVEAMPTRPTTIGNTTYTPAEIGMIMGRGTVRRFAPALTLGYGGANRRGLAAAFDAGILFQGRVRVSRLENNGVFANNAMFLADLTRERLDLQHDIDDYKVYPIAQLSIGYRF